MTSRAEAVPQHPGYGYWMHQAATQAVYEAACAAYPSNTPHVPDFDEIRNGDVIVIRICDDAATAWYLPAYEELATEVVVKAEELMNG